MSPHEGEKKKASENETVTGVAAKPNAAGGLFRITYLPSSSQL